MIDENRHLNIAFFTALDPREISKWSWAGTFHHMTRALQKYCGDVFQIGPISCVEQAIARVIHTRSQAELGKNFTYRYCVLVSQKYAEIAAQRLQERPYDVIIAPSGETEVAFLETNIPIILIEDATYDLLIDYHQEFSNLSQQAISELQIIESLALKRASLVVFSSEWAARSSIEHYQVDKQKVHIIPFGANFEYPPAKEQALGKKKSDRCRMLFVGNNWERKGGSIAFETLLALEDMHIQSELIICGCTPRGNISHERMTVIPFLDKTDEIQRMKLEQLYMMADFFLLPTRNDCTPIVFCEANAFGLPVITTDTGGIAGIIKQGENGFMLPYNDRGGAYAEVIAKIYQDDQQYRDLVRSSRAAFDTRLNWDAWGQAMKSILTAMLSV